MNKFEVTLKQHTPLIHFQHNQYEATLRATEVKPKLDKFLLTLIGKGEVFFDGEEQNRYKAELAAIAAENRGVSFYEWGCAYAKSKRWTISGQDSALNYKLKIDAEEGERDEYLVFSSVDSRFFKELNEKGIKTLSVTPYFAQESAKGGVLRNDKKAGIRYVDEGKWNQLPKKGLIHKKIELSFFSFHATLLQLLRKEIRAFFFVENFGTRQSKGFGSFEVTKITPEIEGEKMITVSDALKRSYSFVYQRRVEANDKKEESQEEVLRRCFDAIQADYQLLKAGKNQRGKYAKSKLFLYGLTLSDPVRWEKRFIKRKIHKSGSLYKLYAENPPCYGKEDKEKKWEERPNEFNYRYLRAVLGLAEQYEFLIRDDNEWNGRSKSKLIVRLKEMTGAIERYKSPLLFKVVEGDIYLMGNDISPALKGVFNIEVSVKEPGKQGRSLPVRVDREPIALPENFSLVEFMRFALGDGLGKQADQTNGESLNYIKIK